MQSGSTVTIIPMSPGSPRAPLGSDLTGSFACLGQTPNMALASTTLPPLAATILTRRIANVTRRRVSHPDGHLRDVVSAVIHRFTFWSLTSNWTLLRYYSLIAPCMCFKQSKRVQGSRRARRCGQITQLYGQTSICSWRARSDRGLLESRLDQRNLNVAKLLYPLTAERRQANWCPTKEAYQAEIDRHRARESAKLPGPHVPWPVDDR